MARNVYRHYIQTCSDGCLPSCASVLQLAAFSSYRLLARAEIVQVELDGSPVLGGSYEDASNVVLVFEVDPLESEMGKKAAYNLTERKENVQDRRDFNGLAACPARRIDSRGDIALPLVLEFA